MKTLLISVSYTDDTNRHWQESYIKNKKVYFNSDTETIHDVIKKHCEEDDGVTLVYKGEPRANIYRDKIDEEGNISAIETIGYMYRGKTEIYDRNMSKPETGRFDVWVTISEIIPFPIEELE